MPGAEKALSHPLVENVDKLIFDNPILIHYHTGQTSRPDSTAGTFAQNH